MCWPSAVRLAGSERAARVDGRSLARASARSRGSWEFLSLIRLGLTMGVQESSGRLRDPDILTSSPIFFPHGHAQRETVCVPLHDRPIRRTRSPALSHTAAAHSRSLHSLRVPEKREVTVPAPVPAPAPAPAPVPVPVPVPSVVGVPVPPVPRAGGNALLA